MTHPASRHEAPCCGNCSRWEGDEATDRAGCRVKRDLTWRNEWCPSHEPVPLVVTRRAEE